MLIRYQAYFNQKVATWLRDRISHSIEATSYGCFYEKNSQTYISWFTSDLEQIKGHAIDPTFDVIGGLFLRLFLRWRYSCIIGLSFY